MLENLQTISIITNNSSQDLQRAIIIFLVLSIAFFVFERILVSRLQSFAKRTKNQFDDLFVKLAQSIKPVIFILISLAISLKTLNLSDLENNITKITIYSLLIYQTITSLGVIIDYFIQIKTDEEHEKSGRDALNMLGKIIKALLWVLGILFLLQNFGVNVTSIIASFGIGGIAIAFAAQNILGDLFSSFSILFDKPFTVGDFVVVGDQMGVVEKIGIKTTRVRALQGEEIVFSNQELTSKQIQNFKKLKERRISFKIGVTYDTSNENIKRIPDILKKSIISLKKLRFDRSHFIEFGDSALIYETVYYVLSDDYNVYRELHQEILVNIKKEFDKNKIEMAFPTQTVYVKKD